jgi:tetratricopeptide (TPR) repeat protein
MNGSLEQVKDLIESNKLDEAQKLIQKSLDVDSSSEALYFYLGQIYYRQQKWGEAINAYHQVLELNPDHKEAQSNIEMAKNILGYFTPDMFNP